MAVQLAQVDALVARDMIDSAIELLEALEVLPFQSHRHLAYLGDLFLDLGMKVRALSAYEKALEQGSSDSGVALNVAHIYLEQELPEEAARSFETAGKFAGHDGYIWSSAGDAWMAAENFEAAIPCYRHAVRVNDQDVHALTYLGLASTEVGRLTDALVAFKQLQKVEPDENEHWLSIGHLQLEIGYPELARQAYERILRAEPENSEAAQGLTAAAFELGEVELAERMARYSVELEPENPDAHYNLGVILLSLTRHPEALEYFEHALAQAPDEPRYALSAATSRVRTGDIELGMKMGRAACAHLDDDATPVFEFVRDLIRYAETQDVLDFMGDVDVNDFRWDAVLPLFEFLVYALRRNVDHSAKLVTVFIDSITEHPEVVPVVWDFEEIERLALGVESSEARSLEMMVAILEGRKDLTALKPKEVSEESNHE